MWSDLNVNLFCELFALPAASAFSYPGVNELAAFSVYFLPRTCLLQTTLLTWNDTMSPSEGGNLLSLQTCLEQQQILTKRHFSVSFGNTGKEQAKKYEKRPQMTAKLASS